MEQRSPQSSSSSDSSDEEERNNLDNADELGVIVRNTLSSRRANPPVDNNNNNGLRITETTGFNPGTCDLSAYLQGQQVREAGPSFARAPTFVELLTQIHGTNANHVALHDQTLLQAAAQMSNNNGNLSAAFDHRLLAQNGSYNNNGLMMMNRYGLPLSNLPPEFRLSMTASSSSYQGQPIGSSQVNSVPFGNSLVHDSAIANAQQAYNAARALQARAAMMHNGNSAPLRPAAVPARMQAIPNSEGVPNGINLARGQSSYSQGASTSGLKRRMVWPEDRNVRYRSWSAFLRGDQRSSTRVSDHIASEESYSLYDERYEEIGLAVDPHLRIFNAINRNGDNDGST